MQTRSGWRELFLQPDVGGAPDKPSHEELSRLSHAERRRAKVAYQRHSGAFRTWVYVVALLLLVAAFVLSLSVIG